MQDFTGVPAVVDLAAMRAAMAEAGATLKINPLSPVDLVIDHSVMVDHFADDQAFEENVQIEMQRNGERYQFCVGDNLHLITLVSCHRVPVFAIRSI